LRCWRFIGADCCHLSCAAEEKQNGEQACAASVYSGVNDRVHDDEAIFKLSAHPDRRSSIRARFKFRVLQAGRHKTMFMTAGKLRSYPKTIQRLFIEAI